MLKSNNLISKYAKQALTLLVNVPTNSFVFIIKLAKLQRRMNSPIRLINYYTNNINDKNAPNKELRYY